MTDDRALDPADERLLDELRRHFNRVDAVPADVLAAAHAAIELRDLDSQLAELLRDSAIDAPELAGVRGDGARSLSFGLDDERFLEIDVATSGERREFSGYVVPGESGTLKIESRDGSLDGSVDEAGRFRLAGVLRGPVRLLLQVPGRPAFATPWLAL